MNRYFATSKDMKVEILKWNQKFWLEYNPNIKMWRINKKGAMPMELMGYNPHKKVLLLKLGKVAFR